MLSGYDWPITVRGKALGDRVQQLMRLRHQCQALDVRFSQRLIALALPNSFSSALELRMAGLSVAGYARDGRSLLLSQRINVPSAPHALESFWALAGKSLRTATDFPPL